MSYTHLTQDERYQLSALMAINQSLNAISSKLGRSKSTISRELKRNRGARGYRPKQAHALASNRFKTAYKAIKLQADVKAGIADKVRLNFSPEQISGRLKKDDHIEISHETIYQYILADKKEGGDLYKHLRCQKKRRKRYGTKSHDRRGQIKDRVSIDKRPKIVEKKSRIGDWEGDLIIGQNHKGAIVTLVDRKSKKTKMAKITSKTATIVGKAVRKLLREERVHTITFDNGREFSAHKEMAMGLGAKIYFAHPYSSWERGLNENTNGLIRQYFPKGSSFSDISEAQVSAVEDALNNRPRKTLNYNTPNEIYTKKRRIINSS